MQVYEKLGLRKEIERVGSPVSSMNITDAYLRPLSKMNFKYFEDKYKVGSIAIHRGKLQQILLNQLDPHSIKLAHQLIGISKKEDEYLKSIPGSHDRDSLSRNEQAQLIFFTAAFSMLAKISKADGQVNKDEIQAVEQFMTQDLQLDPSSQETAKNIFRQAVL